MSEALRDWAGTTPAMRAVFGDAALLRAALRYEAALAEAGGAVGVIAAAHARIVVAACGDAEFDASALAEQAAHAGTLAIPLVARLRTLVAARDPDAAASVHVGGTSQDLADTALALQARDAARVLERDLTRLATALRVLAVEHRLTIMPARTLLQPALPMTLGLKAANWLLSVDGAARRLARECRTGLALQFGGAAGTWAGLGGTGVRMAEKMAFTLGLACPPVPWQARRDGTAGIAAALAICTGAVAKIARDVALLSQPEIGEAFEPRAAGRGGSSAMSHKRNATGCQVALSAGLRAPGLCAGILAGLPGEHERGLGGWQAEAPVLAELFALAHASVSAMLPVAEGLEVHPDRMRANLEAACLGDDPGESAALVDAALASCTGPDAG